MEFEIELQWWLKQTGKRLPLDGNLIMLLDAIKTTGSLQQAARDGEVSYRYAWGLMEKWQTRLGLQLISKQRGRGTELTAAGHCLLNTHQHLQARLTPELINQSTQLRQQLAAYQSSETVERLRLFASHGLAVSELRDLLQEQYEIPIDLHFHGSLDSLKALRHGQCDLAGFHIPADAALADIAAAYEPWLEATDQLVYLVRRTQGLFAPAGNPRQIQRFADVKNQSLQFINRQRGSGTRLLVDELLVAEGIAPKLIRGYDQEEFTHMAVAAMVASGAADCGFGIEAVAARFGLDCIPMVDEHYCLVIPAAQMADSRIEQMLDLLKQSFFTARLNHLEGYDTARCGESVSFAEIMPGRRNSR